jgi:hypothetical protein
MAAHDRGYLKKVEIAKFQVWLDANEQIWRPGKGDFQLMQVKIGKGWGAVCTNAKGVITTPAELAPLIKLFKQGVAVKKGAAPAAKRDTYLDDLRDDFAIAALQGILAYPGCEMRGSHHNNNTPDGVAAMAYGYADAMLAERAKRINQE